MIQAPQGSLQASHAAAWLGGNIDDALSNILVPAFILNRDGVVRWQNARATQVVGETTGRHFSSVVAPEAVHQVRLDFTRQILGTVRTAERRIVMRSSDGGRSAVDVRTISLEDGQRVVGVFGIMEVDAAYTAPAPLREALTPRQHEVLGELARGASTEQIAASLGIARETVRNHVRGVLRSLRVHSRLEAVAEARLRGLLAP